MEVEALAVERGAAGAEVVKAYMAELSLTLAELEELSGLSITTLRLQQARPGDHRGPHRVPQLAARCALPCDTTGICGGSSRFGHYPI